MTVLPLHHSQPERDQRNRKFSPPSNFIKAWGLLRPGLVRGERDQGCVRLFVHVHTWPWVTKVTVHKTICPCHRYSSGGKAAHVQYRFNKYSSMAPYADIVSALLRECRNLSTCM
jgi:hypothetical protein